MNINIITMNTSYEWQMNRIPQKVFDCHAKGRREKGQPLKKLRDQFQNGPKCPVLEHDDNDDDDDSDT
jgi:hypothetical protein